MSEPMSFAEANQHAKKELGEHCYVFLSSPERWSAHFWSDSYPDAGTPFEATWFSEKGQLRWVRRGESGETSGWECPEREPDHLERTYVCWGTITDVKESPPNGSRKFVVTMAAERTGTFSMPLVADTELQTGSCLKIVAWELLEDVGDGNIRVVNEVLRSIDVHNQPDNKDTTP